MNVNALIQRLAETTYNPLVSQTRPKTRKCSLCFQPGHNIQTCNMPEAVEKFFQLKSEFHEITMERLIHPNMNSPRYNDFIGKMKNTKKNLLKFFLMKTCKHNYSHLNTKTKIYAMVMYNLILERLNWIYEHENDIPILHVRFFNAERTYWLHLASGTNEILAQHNYEMRIDEILEQERRQQQQQEEQENNVTLLRIGFVKKEEIQEMDKLDFDCPICMDTCSYENKTTLDCNHAFCLNCIQNCLKVCQEKKSIPSCALCRFSYTSVYYFSEITESNDH